MTQYNRHSAFRQQLLAALTGFEKDLSGWRLQPTPLSSRIVVGLRQANQNQDIDDLTLRRKLLSQIALLRSRTSRITRWWQGSHRLLENLLQVVNEFSELTLLMFQLHAMQHRIFELEAKLNTRSQAESLTSNVVDPTAIQLRPLSSNLDIDLSTAKQRIQQLEMRNKQLATQLNQEKEKSQKLTERNQTLYNETRKLRAQLHAKDSEPPTTRNNAATT